MPSSGSKNPPGEPISTVVASHVSEAQFNPGHVHVTYCRDESHIRREQDHEKPQVFIPIHNPNDRSQELWKVEVDCNRGLLGLPKHLLQGLIAPPKEKLSPNRFPRVLNPQTFIHMALM